MNKFLILIGLILILILKISCLLKHSDENFLFRKILFSSKVKKGEVTFVIYIFKNSNFNVLVKVYK